MPLNNTLGISIVIRTLNEGSYLSACLEAIQSQKINANIEIIVVDSGSIDNTIEIAMEHHCKILKLKDVSFSYGKSLNSGISLSENDVIAVLSAHCIPTNDYWLYCLVRPLLSGKADMVFGRQEAPLDSRTSEFNYFSEKFSHQEGIIQKPLLNNANSAFRKKLWALKKFDEKLLAQEDIEFSLWHKKNTGARLYFSSDANVIHYHYDRNIKLFNRLFRESCVEHHLNQRNLFDLFIFWIMLPNYIFRDICSARKKCKLFSAINGILFFRFIQAFAYTTSAFKYRSYLKLE
jgi:rhamnosyltransferase